MQLTRILAVFFVLLLLVLHNNWWSWDPDFTRVFGRVPFDLVYRVLWVAASTGVLWFVMRSWWGKAE
jgi:hypothetical protein